eukprot:SAG31_NODE_2627_length_5351_cov_3.055979_2_plen_479_part_00
MRCAVLSRTTQICDTDCPTISNSYGAPLLQFGTPQVALSLADGAVLLNQTAAKDNTTYGVCSGYGEKAACRLHGCGWNADLGQCDRIDWFPRAAALFDGGLAAAAAAAAAGSGSMAGGSGEVALIGTDDSELGVAAGMIVAMDLTDHHTRWIANNVSAARLYVAVEASVLVVAVDTRPYFGRKSNVLMLRGFALADGRLLWQRTAAAPPPRGYIDDENGPANGVALGRACEVDCSLPCWTGLVAAGGTFGFIDATTGRTVHASNATSAAGVMPPHAVSNGVAYSIQQGQAIRQLKYSTAGQRRPVASGAGTLVAAACGSGNVLWSALLPLREDGGTAPFLKIVVSSPAATEPARSRTTAGDSTRATATMTTATGKTAGAVVLVGGHVQGHCFRAHCAPSYSAIAAFSGPQAPSPPGPPAPPLPSRCEEEMSKDCSSARTISAAKCEVCCGEHAMDLHKVGCVEHNFEVFCNASPHSGY